MKYFGYLSVLIVVIATVIIAGDYVYNQPVSSSQSNPIVLQEEMVVEPLADWRQAERAVLGGESSFSLVRVEDMEIDYDYILPEVISVPAGESFKLRINSKTSCTFRLDEYDIVKKLEPGQYELSFVGSRSGQFKYSCFQPYNEHIKEGVLIVSEFRN